MDLSNSRQACSADEYQRFLSGDESIHCYSRGQSIGMTVVSEAGFVSLIALLYVFSIIARNVFRRVRRQRRWRIFVDPIDIIMFSLFSGDAIQALGAVVNIKWVNEGKVVVGGYCTAQGVIQQLGETTAAMSTLLIAIYTWRGLWLGKSIESLRVTKFLVCGIWLFVTFMIILGNTLNMHKDSQHRYETPTPYWCWIGPDYLQWAFWGEYFWFWLTLGTSLLTYVPLFFWSRGNIALNNKKWWKFKIRSRKSAEIPAELLDQSKVMLAYPIVYCIAILPLSVCRWIQFFEEAHGGKSTIPSAATFAAVSMHVLSGACNVLLLLTTRPNTVLFGREDLDLVGLPNLEEQQGHDEQDHRREELAERGQTPDSDLDLGRLPSR